MTGSVSLRERRKERTRAAIAAAALELFTAHGFEAVTLTQIADAAEVGHRTVFRYFPDKEELLFGDDVEMHQHLQAALAARPHHEPPATAVRQALVSLAPLWQDRQQDGRARQAVIDVSPALRARERAKHDVTERLLAEGLRRRGLPPAHARLLARTAVAISDEAVRHWLTDRDPTRPGLATRVMDAFDDLTGLLTAT